jgi:hypothetical protein
MGKLGWGALGVVYIYCWGNCGVLARKLLGYEWRRLGFLGLISIYIGEVYFGMICNNIWGRWWYLSFANRFNSIHRPFEAL